MKGSMLVKMINKVIRRLLGIKNRQIKSERERSRALEEANRILSAYVTLLAKKYGELRVSRAEIARLLGHSCVTVERSGKDYLILPKTDESVEHLFEASEFEDGGE